VRSIAAGERHTCVGLGDGTARCWGTEGADLTPPTPPRLSPAPVPGLSGVTALGAGSGFTCALLADHTVKCWGDNTDGRLGDGTTTARATPVAVLGLVDVTKLAVGPSHACAVLTGGALWCWGNLSGDAQASFPTPRKIEVGPVDTVTCGADYDCALPAGSATAMCWGNDTFGQLGDGLFASRSSAAPLLDVPRPTLLAAGPDHACALAAGSVWCWGPSPAAGNVTSTPNDQLRPVKVGTLPQ
jgi:alpha-tubulin suppressor-like RCC1 family protein